ncbi:Rid family hydrolase [Sphingomonas sp.]|uniref:Rid family hydrolase n=1 Tax=Sphingomonas sp. TaxID=28214 RepID=UPI002C32DB44|nr:Rid family hydrolase [Sphingomonas sp.]HTG37827.1 Rid family hydrolase [Sphingomonas sp.]
MPGREAVWPENPHALYREHGYSPAVRAGDMLFVSGQVGARADGTPPDDLAEEVALAFDNLAAILDAADATFDDVVDVTLFMTDPDTSIPFVLEQMALRFGDGPRPALTAPGATWLAGFRFEIKAIVRLDTGAA